MFYNFLSKMIVLNAVFAKGLPIVIPLTILSADPNLYHNKNQSICFLHGTVLYISYTVPLFIISLINLGFYILILFGTTKQNVKFNNNNGYSKLQMCISSISFMLIGNLLVNIFGARSNFSNCF